MKYTCIIVDDNEIERDLLEAYLKKINQFEIKAVFENSIEVINFLREESIDIVFSDIDMPEINGLDLFKNIKNPPLFIFTTSHSEYAVESFNLEAFDFMIKPLSLDRLIKSSTKAIEYLDLKNQILKSVNKQTEESANCFFYIKETKGYTRLNHDEVIYIESLGDFSTIYTATSKHITLVSLKKLQEELPPIIFQRVHKQFIINLNQIVTVTLNEIILKNNFIVPLSLSYKQNILNIINTKMVSR